MRGPPGIQDDGHWLNGLLTQHWGCRGGGESHMTAKQIKPIRFQIWLSVKIARYEMLVNATEQNTLRVN